MKYDIVYSCGHPGTIDLWGKKDERNRKIVWNETRGLCPDCLKMHIKAENIKKGVELHFEVLPDILPDKKSKELKIWAILWFSGDSYLHKDKIRKMGFRWGENTAPSKATSIHRSVCWSKDILLEDFDKILDELYNELPIKRLYRPVNIEKNIEYQIASDKLAIYQKKKKELLNKKPKIPGIIKDNYWNEKIYTSCKSSYIYLNEQKIEIDETTIEILNRYIEDISSFRADMYWLEIGKLDDK